MKFRKVLVALGALTVIGMLGGCICFPHGHHHGGHHHGGHCD